MNLEEHRKIRQRDEDERRRRQADDSSSPIPLHPMHHSSHDESCDSGSGDIGSCGGGD